VLLREAIDAMLAGDVDTGKAILRNYIKATVGFEKLGVDLAAGRCLRRCWQLALSAFRSGAKISERP
jgi:hypothetical protein